jgi:transcriptional regulator with XRE-family HTH domain
MDEKTAFAARLRQAMTDAGLEPRPAVLEKGFNSHYWGRSVTFQAVHRWLNGQSIPAQDKLQALAQWLNIEPHVLRFGTGPIKAIQEKRKRWDEGIGYKEREVFEAFLGLPTPQKKAVREIILGLAQAEKK